MSLPLTAALCMLMVACAGAQLFPGIGHYSVQNKLRQTWYDADNYCRASKGHLAIPETQEEADIIIGLMVEHDITDIPVGIHDFFTEGSWYSIYGDKLDSLGYNTWTPGFPQAGARCGTLTAHGFGNKVCTAAGNFICELPLWSDYELIPSHGYYKLHTEKLPWLEAFKVCEAEGAHIFILNSDEELQALYSRYQWENDVWTGLHHMYENMNYVSIFGQGVEETGFSRWAGREPLGTNKQYPYVTVFGQDGLRIWGNNRPFICEVKLG